MTRVLLMVAGLLAVAAIGAAAGVGSVGLMPMTEVRNTVITGTSTAVIPAYPGGGR